jgi:hypothetical protein
MQESRGICTLVVWWLESSQQSSKVTRKFRKLPEKFENYQKSSKVTRKVWKLPEKFESYQIDNPFSDDEFGQIFAAAETFSEESLDRQRTFLKEFRIVEAKKTEKLKYLVSMYFWCLRNYKGR